MIGSVEEKIWTCIAADEDGVVQADKIGVVTYSRSALFAYRVEAEAWVVNQAVDGFVLTSLCPCATHRYHGPTDAPSNCWSATVERVEPPSAPKKLVHATVITRRGSRRIMGRPGERANLCGAPPGIYDMVAEDFCRSTREPVGSWDLCASCAAAIEGMTRLRKAARR